jgi:hypothetical protein
MDKQMEYFECIFGFSRSFGVRDAISNRARQAELYQQIRRFPSVLVKEASHSPREGRREKSFEGQPLAWLSSVLDP